MEVISKTEGDICVARVQDNRIDAASALTFKEVVRQVTATAGPIVVLDLGRVEFIDSSGLGAIVATMKYLAPERHLILAGLTPAVAKVFQLTRMDQVFDLFSTLDDALAAQRVQNL